MSLLELNNVTVKSNNENHNHFLIRSYIADQDVENKKKEFKETRIPYCTVRILSTELSTKSSTKPATICTTLLTYRQFIECSNDKKWCYGS